MFDWLLWFTHMEHSKPLALVLFFAAFCGVVIYVFTGKRSQRLESYKYIPFEEDEAQPSEVSQGRDPSQSRKVKDNE